MTHGLTATEQQAAAPYLVATCATQLAGLIHALRTVAETDIGPVFDAALAVKDAVDDLTVLTVAMHNVVPT